MSNANLKVKRLFLGSGEGGGNRVGEEFLPSTAGPPPSRVGEGLPSPWPAPSTYIRRGRAPLLDTQVASL